MFHQLPLTYFSFEAHSVIEKGRRLVKLRIVERGIILGWHKNKKRQDRDDSLHYKAVQMMLDGSSLQTTMPILVYCHLVALF